MTAYCLRLLPAVLLALLLASCAGSTPSQNPAPLQAAALEEPEINGMQWPAELPADAVQPWERKGSGISAESEFLPGREAFSTSTEGASENGEATRLESGSGQTAWATYRIPTGGESPGVLSLDVNLLAHSDAGLSEYYVGVANYGTGRWQWQGPFSDSHVRLALPESGALSPVNSFFATLLCHGGSNVDIVGVGLGMRIADDSTPPPVPIALTATAVAGGAELQWFPVLSGDLAGYEIFWSAQSFVNPDAAGVRSRGWIEGSTHTVLTGLAGETFVRLRSVDHNGNASELSDEVAVTPLAGEPLVLLVSAGNVSAGLGEPLSISVSGADSYDYDTDGNGVFDITADTNGSFSVDTSQPGIIRPRVRASGSGGERLALGSVSLIVSSNSRPVASATSDKSVDYLDYGGFQDAAINYTGIAEDQEDSEEQLSFAWDFDGDGIYEADTDTLAPGTVQYDTPGSYNVKFRVTDTAGAWDVDTLNIDIRINQPPVVYISGPERLYLKPDGLTIFNNFSVTAMNPEGEEELTFFFDEDGDGNHEQTDTDEESASFGVTYERTGLYPVRVEVYDSRGAVGVAEMMVEVYNHSPTRVETGALDGISSSLVGFRSGIAIAYRDGLDDELEFMFSHDSSGTNWTEPLVISGADFCSGQVSIMTDASENSLLITYIDEATGDLRFVVKDTLNGGGAWTAPASIDSGSQYGLYNSLVFNEDLFRFGCFYYDEDNGDLLYVQSTNAQGTSWGTPVNVVSNADDTGRYCSGQIVDGNPAVCYYNVSDQDLEYIRADDANGTSWGAIVDAHSVNGEDVGVNCRMTLGRNGFPIIAFNNLTSNRILYIRSNNKTGSSWDYDDGDPLANLSGGDGSLCIGYDGTRAFAAMHVNGKFLVSLANSSNNTNWVPARLIDDDDSENVGLNPAVALVNGRYVVSYFDEDSGDLKVLLPRY